MELCAVQQWPSLGARLAQGAGAAHNGALHTSAEQLPHTPAHTNKTPASTRETVSTETGYVVDGVQTFSFVSFEML